MMISTTTLVPHSCEKAPWNSVGLTSEQTWLGLQAQSGIMAHRQRIRHPLTSSLQISPSQSDFSLGKKTRVIRFRLHSFACKMGQVLRVASCVLCYSSLRVQEMSKMCYPLQNFSVFFLYKKSLFLALVAAKMFLKVYRPCLLESEQARREMESYGWGRISVPFIASHDQQNRNTLCKTFIIIAD